MSSFSLVHKTYKLGFGPYSPVVHAKDITEIAVKYNDYHKKYDYDNEFGYRYYTFTALEVSFVDSHGKEKTVRFEETKDHNKMQNSDWEVLYAELFGDSDDYIGQDIQFYHVPCKITKGFKTEEQWNQNLGLCKFKGKCRWFDDQCDVCKYNTKLKNREEYDEMYCPKDDAEALAMGWILDQE